MAGRSSPRWLKEFLHDYSMCPLERVSELHPYRKIQYKKQGGVQHHIRQKFTRQTVNEIIAKFESLDKSRLQIVRKQTFTILRQFVDRMYLVPDPQILTNSDLRLTRLQSQLCVLLDHLRKINRFDANRVSAVMLREKKPAASFVWYCLGLGSMGLDSVLAKRADELPDLIKFLTATTPAPDQYIQDKLCPIEEWKDGLAYLIGVLANLIDRLCNESVVRHSVMKSRREIVLDALRQLNTLYSEICGVRLGRRRLSQLATYFLVPLFPKEYNPAPETLARAVLDKTA